MILAFDVSYIQTRRAGLGRYATELLRALLDANAVHKYKLYGWSYSIDKFWLAQLQKARVRLHAVRIPGAIKRWYWNQLRFPPVETFIGEFDIFQSTDPFLPPTKGKKSVAVVHDLAYRKFPQFFEPNVLRWDRHVERSLRHASAIIVPSDQTRQDLFEFFPISPERVRVVRPPVGSVFGPAVQPVFDDCVRRRYGLNRPFLLFVGTLEPRKNVVGLIHAFEVLRRERGIDLELVIAGKRGWLYKEILESIVQSPVRERIHYLDYVRDEELAALYRAAEFFVYPSFYEGHGSPVIEAMASGKAVITSRSSSLKEIGEGVAILVDPASRIELLNAMQNLAEDERRRAELGRLGLERAGQFSGAAAANELLSLYDSLLRH